MCSAELLFLRRNAKVLRICAHLGFGHITRASYTAIWPANGSWRYLDRRFLLKEALLAKSTSCIARKYLAKLGDNFLHKPGMKVREPWQTDRQTTVITPLAHALRVNYIYITFIQAVQHNKYVYLCLPVSPESCMDRSSSTSSVIALPGSLTSPKEQSLSSIMVHTHSHLAINWHVPCNSDYHGSGTFHLWFSSAS